MSVAVSKRLRRTIALWRTAVGPSNPNPRQLQQLLKVLRVRLVQRPQHGVLGQALRHRLLLGRSGHYNAYEALGYLSDVGAGHLFAV